MGPEIYLKALAMARNVAAQQKRTISGFTTGVFDLLDLGENLSQEAPKGDSRYYFRPYKTILVRTVADGGESYYVRGRHRETIPALYDEIISRAIGSTNHLEMTPERLQELIAGFSSRRIAVIGDFFLDKYLDTDPRILERSVESGQPAHQVVGIRRAPGAAGTIVNNLVSLGTATVHTVGAIGDDGEAHDLLKGLGRLGCNTSGLLQDPFLMTPTYLKPRDMTDASLSGEHERYDAKNRKPTSDEVIEAVIETLDRLLEDIDAVVVSDQVEEDDCGIITSRMRDRLAEQAESHPDVVFLADSRTHIRLFRSLIIKPNQFEAVDHADPLT